MKTKTLVCLVLALLCGCGDPFSLVCDAAGHLTIEEPPATYPTGSATVPLPLVPQPTASAPPPPQAGSRAR